MADLAKDIEQLKQLKSDLEQFSKRQPEIETIKKRIPEREAKITEKIKSDPKYGTRDIHGEYKSVGTARLEVFEKICDDHVKARTRLQIIRSAVPTLVGLCVFWKKLIDYFAQTSLANFSIIVVLIIGAICYGILYKIVGFFMFEVFGKDVNLDNPKFADQKRAAEEADAKVNREYELLREEIPSRIAQALNNDSQLVADRNKLKTLETEQATVALRIIRNDVLSDQDKDIALVDYVYSQLSTRRADSVKEALQRYDDKKEKKLQDFGAALRHERELEEQRRLDEERREEQRRREARLDREREALRKQYESDNEKLRDKLDDLERSLKR